MPVSQGVPSAEADIFQVEIFIDAVFGTFAVETRLRDPTKGRHVVGKCSAIDAHHPDFQGLPPSSSDSRMIVSAPLRIGRRPTLVDPVKVVLATLGLRQNFSPIGREGPGMTEKTPGGPPARTAFHVRGSGSARGSLGFR